MWDWLINILRIFFFFLDSIVYPLIPTIYNLFMDIANTTIFTEDIIDFFASKVYALLGIFMLFKVSFSILTYIVNPDSFTDKSKGFSKMISNIVISLVLLLFTPWLFSQAMDVQRIILKDNIIGKVFTVSSVSNISSLDAGDTMAYETFLAFYHIDKDNTGYESCAGADIGETPDSEACKNYLGSKYNDFKNILDISYITKNVNFYIDFDLLNAENSHDEYIMSYMPLISTLAGVFVFWVLLMFCFDIAVRSVKLGFLRMIAPVPIISRIDPKKGNDVFNKWVKMSISTYLDLFIRLLAIYFAVFVISIVAQGDFVDASTGLPIDIDPFVKIFIIMGALLFAKQFPKLIKDLTGFDMGGKFTINPFKKVAEVPLIGAGVHTLAGGIDSKLHGNGFWSGVKRNYKDIPLLGGDGKKSIWETSDRKMRIEIHQKRDNAKQRYEGIERQRLLQKQLEDGRKYFEKQKENKSAGRPEYSGIYTSAFITSKESVDQAKDLMYKWKDEVRNNHDLYQAAVNKHGANSQIAKDLNKRYKTAEKNYGTAQGQYEYRKKLHDTVRMQLPDDAEIEDAVEAYEKTGGKKLEEYELNLVSKNNQKPSGTSNSEINGTPINSDNNTSDNQANASNNDSNDDVSDNSNNNDSTNTSNESEIDGNDEEKNKIIQQLKEKYEIAYRNAEKASATFKTIHDRYINNQGIVLPERLRVQLYQQNQAAEQAKEEAIREVEKIADQLSELGVEVSKFIDTYK